MIKVKLKKITNNIELMLLIAILIASTLCIRNTEIFEKIQIVTFIVMSIYIFVRCIKKDAIKLVESKLDIFVLLLIISTLLPQITNSYISLKMTVITVIEYLTIFQLYILAKEACKKNDNVIQILKNLFIIITIFFIFIGIDNLCANVFMNFIKVNNIINGEGRLVSLFGNPNTLAIFIMFSLSISINEMIKADSKKMKIIYATCNTIFILGILLTYSKFVLLMLPLLITLYLIVSKGKSKKIYVACNFLISVIASIMYIMFFQKFLSQGYNVAIFIFTMFWIEIIFILNYACFRLSNAMENISLKRMLIIVSIILGILGVFILIELNNTESLKVSGYHSKIINNIKPNENYKLVFYIDAETDIEDMFIIKIIQRDDRSLEEIESQEILLGNFSGKKEIQIKTSPYTKELKIEFKTKDIESGNQLIINKLEINNKEIALAYRHLPVKLVDKINNINFGYKTAKERMCFIKDGLKLISHNFLTGIGGNCWQFKYGEVQEYGYTTNDAHSYYVQVWLEFGILGLVAVIGIIYCIIRNKKDLGIKIGILAILLHSMMDSDMYFTIIKMLIFVSLGVLNNTKEKENKRDYAINVILIIINIVTAVLLIKPELYNRELVIDRLDKKQEIVDTDTEEYREICLKIANECNKVIKHERYQSLQSKYEIKRIQNYVYSKQENLEEIVKEYYERIAKYKNNWKYDVDEILEKSNNITVVIQILEEQNNTNLNKWIAKLAKINIDEYEETKSQLEIAFNDKHKKMESQIEYSNLNYNYNFAIKMYNKYFTGVAIINDIAIDLREYIKDNNVQLKNKKDVLIYYTHTTEAYNSKDYKETEPKKTLDERYNMLALGEELEKNLTSKGLKVTNIKKYNDLDGIKNAYDNSLKTAKEVLLNKDIEMIFDVHRDSYGKNENDKSYIEINGEKVSNIRFVISTDNDGWENNLKWAISLQKKANELYPGLFKPIYISNENYNQEINKFATLIEIGEDVNTLEEAKRSVKYFSDVLEKVLQTI